MTLSAATCRCGMERSTLTPETVKRSALQLGRLERSPARLRRRSSIDGRFGPRSTGRGTGGPRIKTVLAHTGTSLVWEAISTAQESGRGKIFAPNQKPFFARKNFDSSRLTADTLPPTLNRRYPTAHDRTNRDRRPHRRQNESAPQWQPLVRATASTGRLLGYGSRVDRRPEEFAAVPRRAGHRPDARRRDGSGRHRRKFRVSRKIG